MYCAKLAFVLPQADIIVFHSTHQHWKKPLRNVTEDNCFLSQQYIIEVNFLFVLGKACA